MHRFFNTNQCKQISMNTKMIILRRHFLFLLSPHQDINLEKRWQQLGEEKEWNSLGFPLRRGRKTSPLEASIHFLPLTLIRVTVWKGCQSITGHIQSIGMPVHYRVHTGHQDASSLKGTQSSLGCQSIIGHIQGMGMIDHYRVQTGHWDATPLQGKFRSLGLNFVISGHC